ncbi:MAG: hypothetical protein ORN25_06235, partial [Caulobacteraceae bacterium]|nr:hypothetical protein [Caulobacteraceae bacterium]
MTDLSTPPEPQAAPQPLLNDDRMIAGITYVLFLLLPTFFPVLIGLVLAYANRDTPSAMLRSHYVFQIRTFWIFFGWAVIALAMIGMGIPLSILLVGIPAVILGAAILCGLSLFFALRCVVGLIYLAQGRPYPRPQT